jgi:antitoxin component YwqK of YwqJK toxin-antitoxin module
VPHFDRSFVAPCLAAALLAFASPAVLAVQVCELNGQPVNPNNGYTTEGKTGLMRCRDGEGGPVVREEELQQGKFMGVVRRFRDSALEREYRVNERGNRDGLSREWAPATGGDKPVLVREETYRNGSTVGLVRTWTAAGQPRRIAFHGDDGNERASVEFNAQGQLSELRCAPQPVFGTAFDDRAACGHAGAATTSTLYSGKGQAASRVMVERGVRRKLETLYESGAVHELQESNATGGVERTFAADGTKRREVQWLALAGDRPRRVTTLDQEFHESGKKLRERHWQAGERGELVSEETWYLNGQPKERVEYSSPRSTTAAASRSRASGSSTRAAAAAANGPPVRIAASMPMAGFASSAATTSAAASTTSASSTSAATSSMTTRSSKTVRERRWGDEQHSFSR